MLKALILDFDGVVVESNEVKTDAFRELFGEFPAHAEHMMDYHHRNISVSRFAKFDHLLERLNEQDVEARRTYLAETFSGLVVGRMLTVSMVPGAESFLRTVVPRVPTYLASVTPAEELGEILRCRDLTHWFRDVYGCPPWTKPEAILDVLQRENISGEETLLVGDSAGDQRAARKAGVRFLARNSGLPFDEPTPRQFDDMNQLRDHVTEHVL